MTEDAASRLYLALPQHFDVTSIAAILRSVLATTDVACVRLDLGAAAEDLWIAAANQIIGPCHDADVALVVSDHFRLVDRLGLDGVHLTQAGTTVREARKALGAERIVGAHGGTSRHHGMILAEAGADYVSFGPLAATGALGDGTTVDLEMFEWWSDMIETPCVAEGGISPALATEVADHADFLVPGDLDWADQTAVGAGIATYAEILR